MASSSIRSPYQEALACQLCGFTKTIKVKCMDCNIFMCNDCKVKHSKFKDADLHKVIDIKHVASCSEQLDFKSVKCQEHMDKICCMYCSDCNEMVCKTCISSKHKKHDLEEIENVCRSKEDAFVQSCAKIDIDIKKCLETMKNTRETEYSKYQEIKRKAKDEEKQALKKVQEQFVIKLNIIEEQWEKYERHLSEKRETLTKEQKEIYTLKSEFQNAFDQRNPELILKAIRDLEHCSKKYSILSLESIPVSFCLEKEPSDVTDIRLSLQRHITIKPVRTISSDHENFIWIADKENIWKIDPSNTKTVESHKAPGNLSEIRCTHSIGASLLATAGTQLLLFTFSGNLSIFRDFEPNIPVTIHISKGCQIVVGMRFKNEMNTENKSVIVVLGADGKILKEYINNEKCLLKHTTIQCCTSLEDGSICYNDTNWRNTGRTVKLDENGGVQWIYNRSKDFKPVEVLATKLNNIIVSDQFESYLHILSASGNLLRLIDVHEFSIKGPVVMTLDKNNCLWTANGTNLHCFKIKGF